MASSILPVSVQEWRRLMVSALDSGSSGPGSSPGHPTLRCVVLETPYKSQWVNLRFTRDWCKDSFEICSLWFSIKGSLSSAVVVQSLNSPFFPPHIGAEPGRAKEESRITCMRMLRTPPIFHPIRSKTKTNRDSLARVSPRFALATCNYLEFWLVHCIVCVLCDWLE